MKTDHEDEDTTDSIMQGEGADSQVTSRETQNKQQLKDRAHYRQVASLKQKYYQALQELKKKPQVSTFADLVYGAADFLTDDQLIFFTMQLKSGCPNIPGIKYSAREKMLALAFYLQNPDVYKWLSLIFHLPSKAILERWLEGITRNNPDDAKRLVYNVYTRYIFKP